MLVIRASTITDITHRMKVSICDHNRFCTVWRKSALIAWTEYKLSIGRVTSQHYYITASFSKAVFTWWRIKFHPGSVQSIYTRYTRYQLKFHSRKSRTWSKLSFQNEICPYAPQVSCKGGTNSIRYGIRHVDWLSRSADLRFQPADPFTTLLFQNENF